MKRTRNRIIAIITVVIMLLNAFPAVAFAAESEMDIKVSTVSGAPGDSVAVTIDLSNNPGIASLKFDVRYDQTVLTLTSVSFAEGFGSYVTAPEPYKSPQTISLVSPLAEIATNGLFATLIFSISPNAADNTSSSISITYDEDDIFDGDYNTVKLNVTNGTVYVFQGIPGDIDGDKKVNNKDAILLFRYIAGWPVSVDQGALDVTGDGKVNNRDAITLFRYVAGWPDITLVRGSLCSHSLETIPAKAATCTEAGSIAYWHCVICGKYFGDANGTREITLADTVVAATGHSPIVDPAVPATTTSTGLTEGSHCTVCGVVLVPQEVTEMLASKEHTITYNIANGEPYLEGLLAEDQITNNNPDRYNEDVGLTLSNLIVPGYKFLGWYDGQGDNAEQIKRIAPGTTETVELTAHWEKIVYKVQFKSSLFLNQSETTYTVDTGVVLPTPKLSNYVFTGWADEDGKLYNSKVIPAGTTGNITLTANWTSERNKAWTKTKLDPPMVHIDEDNDVILMVYEIGEIQNVPLYTINDFGYIASDGITKTAEVTYATQISESAMESYAKVVARSTTESSSWTLSHQWNETTSVDEHWCEENGKTTEQAETIGKSNTDTWNVSSGSSGSTDVSKVVSQQTGKEQYNKITDETGSSSSQGSTHNTQDSTSSGLKTDVNATVGMSVTGGTPFVEVSGSVEVSAGFGTETEHKLTEDNSTSQTLSNSRNTGMEISSKADLAEMTSTTTTSSSSWNTASSYGGSSTTSSSTTNATILTNLASHNYGYGSSYSEGGESSYTRALSTTQATSDEYASAVSYSKASLQEVTHTWTTQSTKAGYHRWIVAGTAHVFAVVGYDMAQKAFFVYTFSVMDDETHEFEDYSYTTASYDDEQNGVIPFEVPYEVAETVARLTTYSSGLKIDQQTGTVIGYSGSDTVVVIPEYMNVGNGDVVKITGLSETAFSGNTNIEAVVLSDFITEIPPRAFEGCTSLLRVIGGNVEHIGARAFSGCVSAEAVGLYSNINYLGEHAFDGVKTLIVNASNADVAVAAAISGAENIIIGLDYMENSIEELKGRTLTVPEETAYFELNGAGRTYQNLTIDSKAGMTVINKANFENSYSCPLKAESSILILNQVTVDSSGLGLILMSEHTDIGLQGTVTIRSNKTDAMLSKNIRLVESNPNVAGSLVVSDKLLICGAIADEGRSLLKSTTIEQISEEMFENMFNSATLHFDANGGTCEETARLVSFNSAVGTLPIPEKPSLKFEGWFLEDGTQITEDTVLPLGQDVTAVARWRNLRVYFDPNGGTCSVEYKEIPLYEGEDDDAWKEKVLNSWGSVPSATGNNTGQRLNFWADSPSGYHSVRFYASSMMMTTSQYRFLKDLTDDITLYAIYRYGGGF